VGAVKKALILAAGSGTRLHPITLDTPKCLVDVGGLTPLQHLLACLHACGVEEAIVVIGFMADRVQATIGPRCAGVNVRYVHNRRFDFHGCEHSMSLAHDAIADASSLIIVEGDLLMPAPLFSAIAQHPSDNAVLIRRDTINPTRSVVVLGREDRVSRFVYDGSHQDVYRLIPDRSEILGESLQIWKFSGVGLAALVTAFRDFQTALSPSVPDTRNGLFSINRAVAAAPMHVVPTDTDQWINLNTVDDLHKARRAPWLKRS
jgi:choline kinase